jgi:hypothetical protein
VSTSWFQKCAQLGREAAFASVAISCVAVIIDGMDQAKFRIPRMRYVQRAAKAMEVLHRPSLHVIGLWIQGAVLELAVGDEDLRKDSSTQLEVLARGLDKTLERFGTLPLGLHLQQDNCVREGKNTHVANFMMLMVLLGVFKWTQLGYLRKGHTHENIDQACRQTYLQPHPSRAASTCAAICADMFCRSLMASQTINCSVAKPLSWMPMQVFAQLTKVIAGSAFDTALDVVAVLQDVCRRSGDRGLARSCAYKLDETARWSAWVSQVRVRLKYISGHGAPHMLKFVRRVDLGMPLSHEHGHCGTDELSLAIDDFAGRHQRSADDIMLVVKHHMADRRPSQIIAVAPAAFKDRMLEHLCQPWGVAPKRPKTKQLIDNLQREVPKLLEQKFITPRAAEYLLSYAQSGLVQERRPRSYAFLNHRWGHDRSDAGKPRIAYEGDAPALLHRVRIVNLRQTPGNQGPDPEAAGDDSGDDADPGPVNLAC